MVSRRSGRSDLTDGGDVTALPSTVAALASAMSANSHVDGSVGSGSAGGSLAGQSSSPCVEAATGSSSSVVGGDEVGSAAAARSSLFFSSMVFGLNGAKRLDTLAATERT
eukprot:CCRYP_016041-RD/>CCRYP_016041-RD protein AED:0.48 eAED:1.00 QI:0/0/0/1/0/0/2/0/109